MSEPLSVAIFAKAPVAGFAKTRLIPRLGPGGAAALQARLIERAVGLARAAQLGPISLWCAPDADHDCFKALAAAGDVEIFQQAPGDLGAKMRDAFAVLGRRGPALLMGTDCVVIEPEHLRHCAQALQTGTDAVFLPVEDGGYILVGLNRPAPDLFDAIAWNTPTVMETTRARAANAGLRVWEGAMLWDLDRPEDFDRAVRAGLLPPGHDCPP